MLKLINYVLKSVDKLEVSPCCFPKIIRNVDGKDIIKIQENEGKGSFDINLQVGIQPEGEKETVVANSNFKYMYWSMAQQLAHHTVNGCNVRSGDMMGSGTITGPTPESYGSMLEIAWAGKKPITLDDGTQRKFINDGDMITMNGWAEKGGKRVGFGEVSAKVLPAL